MKVNRGAKDGSCSDMKVKEYSGGVEGLRAVTHPRATFRWVVRPHESEGYRTRDAG